MLFATVADNLKYTDANGAKTTAGEKSVSFT
jgi:hypothetical protein